jgi:hypothetical protein
MSTVVALYTVRSKIVNSFCCQIAITELASIGLALTLTHLIYRLALLHNYDFMSVNGSIYDEPVR